MKRNSMKGVLAGFAVLLGLSGLVGTAGAAPVFFDTVVSFAPGQNSGVIDYHDLISSYTGPSGPGTFDPAAVTALDLVSLALGGAFGPPGSIVLKFSDDRAVVDEPGADILVYDSHGGPGEGIIAEVSQDGTTFFLAGSFDGSTVVTQPLGDGLITGVTAVDIAPSGLSSATFLRLTAHPFSGFGALEAYDLDAAAALHTFPPNPDPAPTPEPSTWVLLSTGLLGLLGYGWRQRRPTP